MSKPLLIANWAWLHPYTVATTLILVGYLFSYCLRGQSEFEQIYLNASWRLLAGEEMFRWQDGYAYPPCKALFVMPFLMLPVLAQPLAWWACNALGLVFLYRGAWRRTGGGRLEGADAPWSEHAIWVAGLATGIFYAFNSLSNQATDVLEAALLIGACGALLAGRDFLAATGFGLAAAMKCTPLLWAGYLIWKGRWRAAAWLVIVAVGVNLLPDLVGACPTGSSWLIVWYQQFLAPMQSQEYLPGTWGSFLHLNQSLAGAFNRWFVADWTWTADGLMFHQHADALDAGTLRLILLSVEGMLVASVLFVWRRGRTNTLLPAQAPLHASLEFSLVLILMVLLSPMSSKSHFTTLILPGFAIARAAWLIRSVTLAGLLLVANLVGIPALAWCGKFVSQVSLYYGAVTIKTALLFGGCALALVLMRRNSQTASRDVTSPDAAASSALAA